MTWESQGNGKIDQKIRKKSGKFVVFHIVKETTERSFKLKLIVVVGIL